MSKAYNAYSVVNYIFYTTYYHSLPTLKWNASSDKLYDYTIFCIRYNNVRLTPLNSPEDTLYRREKMKNGNRTE